MQRPPTTRGPTPRSGERLGHIVEIRTRRNPGVDSRSDLPQRKCLLSEEAWRLVGRELRLSVRELELVQRVFECKKLTTIAQDMHLALGTVKTYSQRIYRKLDVNNQRELTLAIFSTYFRQRLT